MLLLQVKGLIQIIIKLRAERILRTFLFYTHLTFQILRGKKTMFYPSKQHVKRKHFQYKFTFHNYFMVNRH